MSVRKRNKAGLQKEISSIFKGVQIPQADSGQGPSTSPAPESTEYTEPKLPAPELQDPEAPKAYQATQLLTKAAPERTEYTEPKLPAPEPQKPQSPKAYQATQLLTKAAPERTADTEPKPPTPEPQKPQSPKAHQTTQLLTKAAPERTGYTEPKPPTPEPQKPEAQQPKAEPAHLPKFMTAQQPKTEPAQPSKTGPPQQPIAELTQQPKVVPAQRPKKADIDDIDKNVPKKITTVKVSSQGFRQQIKNKLFKPKPGVSTAKQKAMVVMMPLLFIVLIFMLFRGGVFGTSAGKTEAVAENNASGVATAGSNTEIEWEIPAPYPTTLRDPIRLVPEETAQTDQTEQTETREIIKLIVRSILYSKDNPSAVISNRIVHEGDKIQNVSIIKISTDSVEFEMNGKRWTQMVQ
ncbi:MAG: hypothetical protein WAV28_10540 [Sedimentisphaerales bacterium]